jgi:hypothetical protein
MMPRKLDVFDFDGTLFRNPLDTPENRRKFEEHTGMPWLINKEMSRELTRKHKKFVGMRKGWYGRPETLEPPLVPSPAPAEMFITETVEAFHRSKADPESQTLLMTGRHAGIQAQVLRIADDGKLFNIERTKSKEGELFCKNVDPDVVCHFMGDNGPRPKGNKPTDTLPWKIWILEQYMKVYPEIEVIEIWEDREEHVKEFKELHGLLADEVIVNFIRDDR